MSEIWTIRKILSWTTDYFKKNQIASPRLDAEILLAKLLDVSRIELYLDVDRPLSENEKANYRKLIRQRAKRCPLAYITGEKEFWSMVFKVTPDVLIPRPETELIVEICLDRMKENHRPEVLDLGTGTGCIAAAIAHEIPSAKITAIDISSEAIQVAKTNFETLGQSTRIKVMQSNWFEVFASLQTESHFDIIVSNPPYIRDDEYAGLQPEISMYEPKTALAGGALGIDAYPTIISGATKYLKNTGYLVVEIGSDLGCLVVNIFESCSFKNIQVIHDLSGFDRAVVGQFISKG